MNRYLKDLPFRIDTPYTKPVVLSDTTQSSSGSTGALTVAGGVGIGGNLYVDGSLVLAAIDYAVIGQSGPRAAYFTTVNSTGDVTIGGNLTVNGSQLYVQGTNTVYTDSLIELHAPTGGVGGTWAASDGKNIGLRLHYYNAGDKNAAFVFDAGTQTFKLFETGTETNGVFSGTLGTLAATTFVGDLEGNSTSADKLSTARTITFGGDASGSVNFDGSANVTLTVTLAKPALGDLTDVDTRTAAPTNAQVLTWSSSVGKWVPRAVSASGAAVTSVNSATGDVVLTTDTVGEGSTNLYYTAARVNSLITNTNLGSLKNVDTTGAFTGQVLAYDGTAQKWKPSTPTSGSGGGTSLTIQDEGVAKGLASTINFVGEGVTAVVNNGLTTVTITGTGTAAVNSVNGQSGTVELTTDNVVEGPNNLYYTSTRVRTEFLGSSGIIYTPETGVFSLSSSIPTSVNGKNGTVVLTTDDIGEGVNNLYYTAARARSAISISNTPDRLGSISFSSGIITYSGPSVADIRGTFSAGTGITIVNGAIAIGQAIGTGSSPTFNNLTVQGNLNVLGTTTTIGVTNYAVTNNNLSLNSGVVGAPSLNATISVDRGTSPAVALRWNESATRWEFTNNGTTYFPIPASTDALAEGSTNLYYTTARARSAFTAGSGIDIANGIISINSAATVASFNTRTGAVTLGSGDVTGALGYTPANRAGDTFTGRVVVPAGATGGLAFPNDPYGGSGDAASITLVSTGGENIQLTFAVGNDSGDTINFIAPSAGGVKINGSSIWSTATLNSLGQLSNDVGFITTSAVTSVNTRTGAVVLTADDIADGITNHFFSHAALVTELGTTSIDALSDVDTATTTPIDGQALVWNAGTSRWSPGNVAAGSGGSGGSSSAPGQVFRAQYPGDANTVAFTLPTTPSSADYALIYVDGILQDNTTYTISGTTLTFTNPPGNTSTVEVAVIKFGTGTSTSFTQLAVTGTSTFRDIIPEADSTYNIGSAGYKWNNAYIKNLTVTGTVTYLSPPQQVTQSTLNVTSTNITLNAGFTSGEPTQNADIIVQRGDLANATIRWNETTKTWQFSNGGAFYNVPITTDTLSEGTNNQYFTAARSRAAISVTGYGTYDSGTGVIDIQGGVTSLNQRTGAITLGSGDITSALTYTPANKSGDTFTGRVRFREGANYGFGFNDNAFGGSGDSASITLIRAGGATTGENQELRIAVANDTTDIINLVAPGSDGVQINGNRIWHAANLTRLGQLTNDQNYITASSVPVASVAGRTGAIVLTTADVSEGANLYYTTARATTAAVAAIAAASINALADVDTSAKTNGKVLTWDSTVGQWVAKVVTGQEGTITSLNGKQGPGVTLYTDDIPEGSTRLYYTAARVNSLINQTALDRLIDVNTASAQDGQALVYNSLSNTWTPKTVGGSSGGLNIYDETTQVGSNSNTLKFVGAGVTAGVINGVTTITITGTGTAAVNSVNGVSGTVVLDTDNVDEGVGLDRRYFTEARARASISIAAGSSLLYDNATGVLAFVDAVTAVAGKTGNVLLNTDDITEAGQLFYTNARADARIAAATIGSLSNVTATGTAAGAVLVYNSGTSKWTPTAVPLSVNSKTGVVSLGLGDLNNVGTTPPATYQFLQYDGTKWIGHYAIGDGSVIDGGNMDAPSGPSGTPTVVEEHVLNDFKDVNTTGVTAGQYLSWNGTNWVPRTAPLYGTRVYQLEGRLSLKSGLSRWYAHEALTVVKIKAQVDIAPAGSDIVCVVKQNGSVVLTFSISAGTVYNPINNINITAAEDDFFTVDLTQVGSTTPGQNLLVTFVYI
jgi:hypothetical protein